MYEVLAGDTINLQFLVNTEEGTPLEAEDIEFNIYTSDGTLIISYTDATKIGVGNYQKSYTIPMEFLNKQLLVEAKGVYNNRTYLETTLLNVLRIRE